MRVAVVSFREEVLIENLKRLGHKIVKRHPDVVVVLGGDGSLLWAEKIYPSIPKFFIYDSKTSKSDSVINISNALEKLETAKFKETMKITAKIKNKEISAMNDINIHYTPPRALRFDVKVDGKLVAENIIGDGIVASTPFGSSGYFNSITEKTFKKGIGLAFNNPTKKKKHMIVKEFSEIEITIKRENGILAWDSELKPIHLKAGDVITIRKSPAFTKIAMFKKKK